MENSVDTKDVSHEISMDEAFALGLLRRVVRDGRHYIAFPPEMREARAGKLTPELEAELADLRGSSSDI